MNNFNLDANINHDFKPIHANRFRLNQIDENARRVWWFGTRVGQILAKQGGNGIYRTWIGQKFFDRAKSDMVATCIGYGEDIQRKSETCDASNYLIEIYVIRNHQTYCNINQVLNQVGELSLMVNFDQGSVIGSHDFQDFINTDTIIFEWFFIRFSDHIFVKWWMLSEVIDAVVVEAEID